MPTPRNVPAPTDPPRFPQIPAICWVGYATPIALLGLLILTYLVAPDFYLRYVLEYQHREYQAVEMITFGASLLAAPLLMFAAWRAWRDRPTLPPGATLHQRFDQAFPAGILLSLALASFFLAGEEVSWGQTFKYWGIAEIDKPRTHETNIHNNLDIPMQTVGQVYLMAVIFGVPIAWKFRRALNLPAFWRPAVADGPVIFCTAVALAWKFVKELYVGAFGDEPDDRFYVDFIEQLNEQKEMLVAVALLMFGLFRLRHESRRTADQPPSR